jgi:uncharacterized protein
LTCFAIFVIIILCLIGFFAISQKLLLYFYKPQVILNYQAFLSTNIPYFYPIVHTNKNFLRFNIGFIIHEDAGYTKQFDFSIDELYIPPDLELADLTGKVTFGRTPQGIIAHVQASANLEAECVRCLDVFIQHVQTDFSELFAFDKRSIDDEGLLVPEDGYVDLAPMVREYLLLDLPIKPICQQKCTGLDPETGEKRTSEPTEDRKDQIDPRMEVLKKLLDNSEGK